MANTPPSKGNSGNTNGGTETSFTNTPQAKNDAFGTPVSGRLDYVGTVYYLNVMGNDLGGNAKSLWSVDDGVNQSGAMSGYEAGDLLTQDQAGVTGLASNRSRFGAGLSVTADGRVAYDVSTIDAGYAAQLTGLALGETMTDSFIYAIRLANGTLSWAGATVVLTGVNDKPTVQGVTLGAIEDGGAVTGNFVGDDVDSDDDGSTLTYSIIGAPSLGTLTNNGLTFTYDPGANFQSLAVGETTDFDLTYTATDKHGAVSDPGSLKITVTGVNDAPTLAAGSVGATEDGATVSVDLSALGDDIDSDDDGNSLTYSLLNAAVAGSASISGTTLSFNPGSDFQSLAAGQTQSFDLQVRATDAHNASVDNIVTVTVTGVNDRPEVQGVSVNAVEDGPAVSGNFVGDDVDSDDDGSTLTYSIIGAPALGTLTNNGLSFTYNPGANFQSLAAGETKDIELSYTATDKHSAVSTPGSLKITVTGVNDAPTLAAGSVGATEDGAAAVLSLAVLGNDIDSDDDGSTLTYSLLNSAPQGVASISGTDLVFNPGNGFQSLAAGQTTSFNLQVKATDAHNASATNTVKVTVTGVNDAPVINGGDPNGVVTASAGVAAFTVQQWVNYPGGNYSLASIKSYTSSTAPSYSVTTNVIDYTDDPGGFAGQIPGSTPWPAATATGASGTGASVNNTFVARITGQLVVAVADTYTFQTYNDDGVYLHVNNQLIINDPTLHPEQVYTGSIYLTPGVYPIELFFFEHGGEASLEFTYRNSSGTYTHVVAADKLGDAGVILFSDVDLTDAHTVSVVPNGANIGNLTAAVSKDTTGTGNGGQVGWNYSVDNKAVAYLGAGESITETFTVTVDDNKGGTAQQTVSVVVNGVNDAPVITTTTDQARGNTMEDTTLSVSGQIGISDVDVNDTHTWSIASQTSGVYGSASVNGTGLWTYTVNNGTNGVPSPVQSLKQGETRIETFTVRASDGKGGNADQIVHVVVAGINDKAVLGSATVNLVETNATLSTGGTLSISDVDTGEAQYNSQSNTSGAFGKFSIDANGAWSYTTNGALDFLNPGQVVTDNFNVTSVDGTSTTVKVNITGTADGPDAINDSNMVTASKPVQNTGNTVYWVDWQSATFVSQAFGRDAVYNVKGTITLPGATVIDVTYTGQLNGYQLSGGTDYFVTGYAAGGYPVTSTEGVGVYTSPQVGNGPTNNDYIQLFHADSPRNLTFSQNGNPVAVSNLFFAIISMNANGYLFDQPFAVVSSADSLADSGYWGYSSSYTISGSGNGPFGISTPATYPNEFHGVLAIQNALQSLTWTSQSHENWNGFTIGTYGLAPSATVGGNVLSNDVAGVGAPNLEVSNVNGQAMLTNSVTLTLPSGAILKVDKDGDYLYDDNGKFAHLKAGQTQIENVVYTVKDNFGLTDTATLSITVTGVNDAPKAINDNFTINEDTTLNLNASNLLANDQDPDAGDGKFLVSVQGAVNGNVVLNGSTVTFNPLPNFSGNASFTYTMSDTAGATSTATVNVNVNPVNDGPSVNVSSPVINNGSFENGLTGWTSSEINYIGDWQAANGTKVLDMNAEKGGGYVEQTLQTVAGATYVVSFALSKNPGSPGGTETLRVSATGAPSQDYVFNSANSTANMQWVDRTYSFTATGPSTTLRLASADPTGGSDAWGPALDNVRISLGGNEDATALIKGITLADVDSGSNPIRLTLSTVGALSLLNTAGLTAIDGNGSDGSLDYSGTLANLNNALASGVSYSPDPNFNGDRNLSVTVEDLGNTGGGNLSNLSAQVNVPIKVAPVNDAPDIVFRGLTINNASFEANLNSATDWRVSTGNIDRVSGWQAGDGSYSIDMNGDSPGGITQTLNTTPGATYTIGFMLAKNHDSLGTISSAKVQVSAGSNAGQIYTFNETTTYNPSNLNWRWETFTFTANGPTTDLTFLSQVATGAKGAAIDGLVSLAARSGTPTKISGLSVTDADAGDNPMQLNLSVSSGTLSLPILAGLTAIDGNGSDGTLAYTGSLAAINSALAQGLFYTHSSSVTSSATLVASVSDLGATGGNALSDSVSVPIQLIGTHPDHVF